MARRSTFKGRLALRKALRNFNGNVLKGIYVPPYVRMLDEVHKEARKNAPVGKNGRGGRLRGNIKKYIRTRKAARAGKTTANRIGRFIVYSDSIQDHVIYHGIPNGKISGKEITKRQRYWKGKKHRPKPAGNFAKGGGKKRADAYNGRDWAFGERKANKYLDKGKNQHGKLVERNKKLATEIGSDILNWISKEFQKNGGSR